MRLEWLRPVCAGRGPYATRADGAADDDREPWHRGAIDRFAKAYGRPERLAVTGLPNVVAASRAQAVETLLLDTDALPGIELSVGAILRFPIG